MNDQTGWEVIAFVVISMLALTIGFIASHVFGASPGWAFGITGVAAFAFLAVFYGRDRNG